MTDNAPGPIATLRPVLMGHDWGSVETIPRLLGHEPDGHPVAELWISAHPGHSSVLADGSDEPLDAMLARTGAAPLQVLVKVLAVARPLSLQLHPDDEAAAGGFAAEQAAWQAGRLAADRRRFTDPHGKPEMLCVVDDFAMLTGLRPAAEALDLLARLDLLDQPDVDPVVAALRVGDVAAALVAALQARSALTPLVANRLKADRTAELDLARMVSSFHPTDAALPALLLLRQHRLTVGQALWCPPGCPHVYVYGTAVEVEPSADTTVRAGLTSKPTDVGLFLELLTAVPPHVLAAVPAGIEDVVTSPDGRLRLGVVRHRDGVLDPVSEASLLVCLAGGVELSCDNTSVRLAAGDGAYVAPGAGPLRVGGGIVVRASTLNTTS